MRLSWHFADLEVREDGCVGNRRFETRHGHQFPCGIVQIDVAAHYPVARVRHERPCGRTRKVLLGWGQALLAYGARNYSNLIGELACAIAAYTPSVRFHLVCEPDSATEGEDWRGDFAAWYHLLAPFYPSVPRRLLDHCAYVFASFSPASQH